MESTFFKDCYQGSVLVEEREGNLDDEMEEVSDDGIPTVKITADLKKTLRDPWRLTLIVKLLGKTVAFNVLQAKQGYINVETRWWIFELIDLGYGFYAVKFDKHADGCKVMAGGPWKIMVHYLTV